MAHRSALVTGASRGIGLAIAKRLTADGFDLTITARDPQRLEDAAAQLREVGPGSIVALAGELGTPEDIAAVVRAHEQAYSSLSVLVLNAGVGSLGPIGEIPAYRFQRLVDINMFGPLHYLQESLPLLRGAADADENHGAKVIALTSITGVYAEPQLGIYGATKAALKILLDTFNVEQSATGITVTAIAPGYVDTDLAAWKHDVMSPETFIPADDVAVLVGALAQLSRRTMIDQIVMARSNSDGRRA